MRKFIFFAAISSLVFAASNPCRAESDLIIVPGERVGPVKIGMLMDEVGRVLGSPTKSWTDETMPGRRIIRKTYRNGLQVDMLDGPAPWVCHIYVASYLGGGNWHTGAGLRLGDSGFDINRKEGSNYRSRVNQSANTEWSHATYDNGFNVDLKDRRIMSMDVWMPGHSCTD